VTHQLAYMVIAFGESFMLPIIYSKIISEGLGNRR
jgi:hypothetical protein